MKILLDNTIYSLQQAGGVSAVWSILTAELQRIPDLELYFLEYADAEDNIFRKTLNIPQHRIVRGRNMPIFVERYSEVDYKSAEPFVFHSPYYRICNSAQAKNLVTLHDFIYELAGSHGVIQTAVHKKQKVTALKSADIIAAVSQTTLNDLHRIYPQVTTPAEIVHNAAICIPDGGFKPVAEPEHYILYVGARQGYKNFKTLVKLLEYTDLKLVVAGSALNAEELRLTEKMRRFGLLEVHVHPDNAELSRLYSRAWCMVYPSSYEGFGIPIIEAQAHGCPVITLNTPACLETGADALISLNKLSEGSLMSALHSLADSELRTQIITKGMENARRFSAKKMAEKYVELYKRLLN